MGDRDADPHGGGRGAPDDALRRTGGLAGRAAAVDAEGDVDLHRLARADHDARARVVGADELRRRLAQQDLSLIHI